MKVKQVVGEHKKGFRAKKYASKPKSYIEPIKPQGPVAPGEQKKQQVKEGAIDRLYGHWMNSEDAPMDDDSGDYNSVYKKAVSFLNGRVNPKYVDNFANALTSYFHGEDDLEPMNVGDELDETTPIGVVSNVSPDGKQVTIKKTDGTELKTTGDAVLPGPDGKTASLAPGAGNELKPGTPVTSGQEQAVSEEPNEDISFAGVTQHDNGDMSYSHGPMSIRQSKDGSTDAKYDVGNTQVRVQKNPIGVKTMTAKGDWADDVVGVDASAQRLGVDPAKVRPHVAREAKELDDMLRIAGLR